uniref:RNA polymerase II-associated protein 3 n=1 Tax=Ascaris lumbricoides TaxID=6252 RepID=A0A9J2Q8L0_ASCLU
MDARKAIAMDPSSVKGRYRNEKALMDARKAIAMDPSSVKGRYRNEKALMDARKAIAMDPSSVKGRYRHAMALINLELYEMAFDDLEKILEIDPKNKETLRLKEAIKDKKNAKEVRLACVDKCDTIRSEVPLKELTEVRVVGSIKKEKPSKVDAQALPLRILPNTIPPSPCTSYQFLFDYTTLKTLPEMFAEYFLSIRSADYKAILGEVIETDMISVLVEGYHRILTSENFLRIIDSLVQLSSVPRFDIASMFLDADDKQDEASSVAERRRLLLSRIKRKRPLSVQLILAMEVLSIRSVDYKAILGEVIETDMISVLVEGYHRILTSENFLRIIDSLVQLSSVPRFDIASMFLDADDKQALRGLLQRGELDDPRKTLVEQLYDL